MALKTRKALAEQVRLALREYLNDGTYPPGSRLPNEEELSESLGVSRTTLREALQTLEQEGLVIRRHGYGTFVNQRSLQLKNSLDINFGVTDLIQATGHRPGTRNVTAQAEPAGVHIASRLGIAEGAEVLRIERVRTADDHPVIFSVDILPTALLAPISYEVAKLANSSLYQFVSQELGLAIHHGVAHIRPLTAELWLARKLELPEGALLLYLEQVDYTLDQKPVLLSHEYHVPDAFEISVYRRGPG